MCLQGLQEITMRREVRRELFDKRRLMKYEEWLELPEDKKGNYPFLMMYHAYLNSPRKNHDTTSNNR